jgi:hypothetical protein
MDNVMSFSRPTFFNSTKLKAAGLHLFLSVFAAAIVMFLVYENWYYSILAHTQAIGSILLIVLAVDVVLGPLMTLIVFKVGKKSLKFDLSCIALAQLIFLGFGLNTVFTARPAFLVFAKDRFEVMSPIDWADADSAKASIHAKPSFFRPQFVGAITPSDPKERDAMLTSSLAGGADLAQMPQYYVPYDQVKNDVLKRLKSLSELKQLNVGSELQIQSYVKSLKLQEDQIGYLPLRGKINDAAVLINRSNGEILELVNFKPWV